MVFLSKTKTRPLVTIAPDDGEWQPLLAHASYRRLHLENSANSGIAESGTLRLQAGSRGLLSGQRTEIEILVQDGELEVDGQTYRHGDFCILPPSNGAWPIASPAGSLCFIRRQGAAVLSELPWLLPAT